MKTDSACKDSISSYSWCLLVGHLVASQGTNNSPKSMSPSGFPEPLGVPEGLQRGEKNIKIHVTFKCNREIYIDVC